MLWRWIWLATLASGVAAAAAPESWVPLRWEGGPLEVQRRARPDFEAASPIEPDLLLRDYEPEVLALFEKTPFNCLLLTWSLGDKNEADAAQRQSVTRFAEAARAKGLATLGVIYPGADWAEAVEAASKAGLDGVALNGPFRPEQSRQAAAALGEGGVAVTLSGWREALQLADPAIRAGSDGVWPALLSAEDASEAFNAGPTTNPWVVANAWRVDALRADRTGRPVWAGHRPKRYREQPFVAADYVRAIADTAMAGGRWAVSLDGEWQAGLLQRQAEKLAGWKEIAATAAFFEEHADWRKLPPQPAIVVVHDPATPDEFSLGETLNLLAVRHVPHRLTLRAALAAQGVPPGAQALTFDFPPTPAERDALKAFAESGGIVFTGPQWARAGIDLGTAPVVAGGGGVLAYPDAELDEDRFATDLRRRLDEGGRTIRLFNTGTLMSFYTESDAGDRAVLHLTEYSDYPTDNVTVRLPKPIQKAVWVPLSGEPEDLQVYDTEGGGEIVIPEVPGYCAVVVDFETEAH